MVASSSPSAPPRSSGLAILALASSLVFCVPIGVLLGLFALVRIQRAKGALTGSALAIAAVVISLGLNAGTYFFMARVYPVLMANSECFAQQLLVGRELSEIQKRQWAFKEKHQRFGSLREIGFKSATAAQAYGFKVMSASEEKFVVRATAMREGMGGDAWELDEGGMPRNVVSGCIR